MLTPKENIQKALNHQLKKLLAKSRVNASRFTAKASVHENSLYKLFAHKSIPSVYTLYKIAYEWEVSFSWLLGFGKFQKAKLPNLTEQELLQSFSDRLVKLLEENEISQSLLCEFVHSNPCTISGWITQKFFPVTPRIYDVCYVFDVDPNYLLGFTDEPFKVRHEEVYKTEEVEEDETV